MRRGWVIAAAAAAVVVALAATSAGRALWLTQREPVLPGPARAAAKPDSAASAVPLEFLASEVVQPGRASLSHTIEFSGTLVAPNTAVLRAKAAGTLLGLSVHEGDRVRAGQVVGRIDMADLGSRIAERGALLESARATLAQAERSQASNERLAAQGFISANALDTSRGQVDTARAGLQAAQATLETTRIAQRDAALVAPIAGIVAKRHVLPGEKVVVEQPVLTLVDLAQLELAGSVATHEVARLSPGMAVRVTVEGSAAPLIGQLIRIAPSAEAGTRSIGVTVALPNAQERLRGGQYALARVELADPQQRMVLPAPAVGSSGGQSHVWLVDKGLLVRPAITLGRRDEAGDRVEVLDGLAAAAQVLAARFDNLREGAAALVVVARTPPVASGVAQPPATAVR
ncbi:MAG: efflux RND transporter periplasmic adaptor subunit [Microbacteriaceae bacterium]|nr:efflux RND transporter periplasmic adaptor subunit [Burkholderiaceae bacterium]